MTKILTKAKIGGFKLKMVAFSNVVLPHCNIYFLYRRSSSCNSQFTSNNSIRHHNPFVQFLFKLTIVFNNLISLEPTDLFSLNFYFATIYIRLQSF